MIPQRIAFIVLLAYLWVMMILLGSVMLETFMVYPNIFDDPPGSFATALAFMKVRAPHDFYPPLGLLSWVTGVASLVVGWTVRTARYWILVSLAMIVGEGLVSMAFFWPRNAIMFIEGPAVHSAEVLRRTALEFQQLHWLRVAFNVIGSVAMFTALLKYYRHMITRSSVIAGPR